MPRTKKPNIIYILVDNPMAKILGEKAVSMKEYPNIQPGQDFEGYQ